MGRILSFFNNYSSKNGAFPMETRRCRSIPLRNSDQMFQNGTELKIRRLELSQEIVSAGNFKAAALFNV